MQPISDGIFLVPGPKGGRFPFSHSVLILDRVRVLIDAGCGRETLSRVQAQFAPDLVFLSHAHPDHCSGSSVFSPSQLWTPVESRETTGRLAAMAERFIGPRLRSEWMSFIREKIDFRDFQAQNTYGADTSFDLGTHTLIPVHAPGHADDHYGFHLPEAEVMVCTDIDFTPFGPWYGNEECDIDLFIQSIRLVRSRPMKAAVSSHRGVIRDDISRRFDLFLDCFDRRDERILGLLDRPRGLDELADEAVIYGSFPVRPRILRFWERQMLKKHLQRLKRMGKVKEQDGEFHRTGREDRA